MSLELPPGGLGGRLCNSAALARTLHDHFLGNRSPFERMPAAPIPWTGRLSINVVAWLGTDPTTCTCWIDTAISPKIHARHRYCRPERLRRFTTPWQRNGYHPDAPSKQAISGPTRESTRYITSGIGRFGQFAVR
ncbi:hypothetical protein [Nocardia sp. BMG111209]|uniref:hypothetical protein n=1 Tax=Nocardia sp. BMG111209 TaxID=1160137 RepID=UPI0012DC9E8A|nr:hypothetical protein [Nocardia sp. BMG111209]